MAKRTHKRFATLLAVTSLLVAMVPVTAEAYSKTYNYDDCQWKLYSSGHFGYAIPQSMVKDMNNGCGKLWAKIRYVDTWGEGTITRECPVQYDNLAGCSTGGITYNLLDEIWIRGKIQTLEHAWYQDSGWKKSKG